MKTIAAEWTGARMRQETSAFMLWWESVNAVLRAQNEPEMLYGEARGVYGQYFSAWR